jgi:cytochrome c-type biogenesis protein CcmH
MKQRRALLIIIAVVVILAAIWSYVLFVAPAQETLDQRVHDVASQLKCLVCQGESVADSPATLSLQMRGIIRQQLQEGKTDQQIIQYFQSRYGNQILWSPPKQGFTLLAWIAPIVMLLGGALLLLLALRGWLIHPRTAEYVEGSGDNEQVDARDLEQYQAQLEQELAADDPLFAPLGHAEAARATARLPLHTSPPTLYEGNAHKEVSS